MSLSIVYTRAVLGVTAPLITVEVHISPGLPGLTIVGLPETTVKEARDRVRSALINSGYDFPARKITINLAPADLPKEGGRYDLPMALALLAASDQLSRGNLAHYEFIGELALAGSLRGVPGAISCALAAKEAGRQIIVATDNADEVSLIGNECSLIADHLQQVCAFIEKRSSLPSPAPFVDIPDNVCTDLQEIIGQEQGETCARNRRCGWPQSSVHGTAWYRENNAGIKTPWLASLVKRLRSAGKRRNHQFGGSA